ncbi:aldehyde dehydrogenase family protein [Oligoflexus tunisiensis]|uniref:aldehyde dehydrogenase family protein n=1 Tax=Oligoflexus tunisiensis TaxID=708132 RepID=UPI000AE6E3A3|nr:aldehyde dehydrogenase family protein [Oligoflexus tunisiensis]
MLSIVNPATEEVIQEVRTPSAQDIKAAYAAAVEAQKRWADTPYLSRAKIITEFRQLLEKNSIECASVTSSEMGKPVHQAVGEIKATLMRIDWFLENTPKELAAEQVRVAPPMIEEISYEPLGVIGNISAWNFPYFVGSNVFIPALLTGNAVLYKPSEFSTLTGLKLAHLFEEAGLPAGLFQALPGGPDVGKGLSALPLNGMFFTGSFRTGQRIAETQANRFTKVGLELGGKDPAYVCDDVDVKTAAESVADGAFYNAGQSCCAVERIYVHAKVYDEFLAHFKAFTASLVIGDPRDSKTYMGPVARQAQLEILREQVQDALDKGAQYLVKGGRREGRGYFYEPTALIGVNHSMKIMRDESFGPIIGIQKVASDEEALALMNDNEYGLTSSVHTLDKARAIQLMKRLNSGTVYWNCCDRVSPYLPWTGRKASGMGSTLSHIGVKTFLQPKAWHLRHPGV